MRIFTRIKNFSVVSCFLVSNVIFSLGESRMQRATRFLDKGLKR